MKKAIVDLNGYFEYSCGSCSFPNAQFEISDEVADLLTHMLSDKGETLDEDDITDAIEAGHNGLKAFYETIEKTHRDCYVAYWLIYTDNDCIDESLEPAFWKDIKDGLYLPEKRLIDTDFLYNYPNGLKDADIEDQEERNNIYNIARKDYLDWVYTHLSDLNFVAERVGIDLDVLYEDVPELMFSIIKITP